MLGWIRSKVSKDAAEKTDEDRSRVVIIAGLGNPGRKYEHTRHNCGYEAVDRLAEKYGITIDDLYSVVMDKSDIRASDGYHYTDEGYCILGRAMADFIKSNI